MKFPSPGRFVGLAALCLFGGCDVQFPEEEVRFRHDEEADTLDVLLVYRGVATPEDGAEALAKGRAVVERVLGGRREFMFLDWPFNFDLDKEYEEGQEPGADVRAALDRVQLERVGAFHDDEGRLCGFQHFQLGGVSEALALANGRLDLAVLHQLETGGLDGEELPWIDEPELRAWREFIETGTPWVSLERGLLVVRLPATRSGAARFLLHAARALREEPEDDLDFVDTMLRNLSGCQVSDGVATLHFGLREGADTVLHLSRSVEYSPALHDLLVADGLDLTGAPDLAQVRTLLGRTVETR